MVVDFGGWEAILNTPHKYLSNENCEKFLRCHLLATWRCSQLLALTIHHCVITVDPSHENAKDRLEKN
ncbi:CLUMA_CG021528, isoform A [Clunio marinus]|uniref:CLUMA_CG021528, isoform A n=1 Tax=Clunio marinus TaxID=568069 RepID=A0A1J1J8J1_9DIPT|nr:CLUMA_CG021528, isoform A [Clunio marinus]